MTTQRPVAGYYRISKERDGMIAPEIYESKLRSYMTTYDLRLVEKSPDDPFFHDIDVSGRAEAWHKRKGLQELLARRSEFSGIVVPSFSRLGRSTKDVLELFSVFDKDGIDLYVIEGNISTTGPYGNFTRTMLVALAQLQSDQISEGWQDAFEQISRLGRVPGAAWAPYGYIYDKEKKNLIPDPATVPVVQEVFQRFTRGESGSAIARDLNERGIPFERRIRGKDGSVKVMRSDKKDESGKVTQSGSKRLWWTDAVHRIIEQPIYVGRFRMNDQERNGAWETFIDEDTWKMAQVVRQGMKSRKPRESRGSHLLSGMLICGECGKNLHYVKRANDAHLYSCRNKLEGADFSQRCKAGGISAKNVETFVIDSFLQTITWEHVQIALRDLDGTPKAEGTPVADHIKSIEDKLRRSISLQLNAPTPKAAEMYKEEIEAMSKERDRLSAQQASQDVEPGQRRREIQTLGSYFRRMAKEFPELWDLDAKLDDDFDRRYQAAYKDFTGWSSASPEERRHLLDLGIDKVVMNSNGGGRNSKTLSIRWKPWVQETLVAQKVSA